MKAACLDCMLMYRAGQETGPRSGGTSFANSSEAELASTLLKGDTHTHGGSRVVRGLGSGSLLGPPH